MSATIRALARLLDASYLDGPPTDGQRDLWREAVAHARDEHDRMRLERNEAIARAKRAEAQLAALHDAARAWRASVVSGTSREERALVSATDDTTAAVEPHTRRVRAEALREAARDGLVLAREWGREEDAAAWAAWLRDRAAEIERGAR